MKDERTDGLLAWQWRLYPEAHTSRVNLAIHAITMPLFALGLVAVVTALLNGALFAWSGLLAMVLAIGAQARGHALEAVSPAPFRGPLDVIARLFVEQFVTFPRFVLSGGFARAWRAAR
jgi:hypothetical protein